MTVPLVSVRETFAVPVNPVKVLPLLSWAVTVTPAGRPAVTGPVSPVTMNFPRDWTVTAERGLGQPTLDGLRRRGHELAVVGDLESLLGHAHAIEVIAHGYMGATDPRAEGAVLGF